MSRKHRKKRAARLRHKSVALPAETTCIRFQPVNYALTAWFGGGYIEPADTRDGVGVALRFLDPMRGEVRR